MKKSTNNKSSLLDQALPLDSFLLICKENVRAKRFLQQYKNKLEACEGTSCSLTLLRAEQFTAKDLVNLEEELRNLDIFGSRKILAIWGVETLKANINEKLCELSKLATANTKLLLQASNLASNSKLLKFYQRQASHLNIPELKGMALKSWVQAEFKNNELPLGSHEVIDTLIQLAENSPDRLVLMTEQLACYTNGQSATKEDLKELFASTSNCNQYELIDKICLNKKAAAEILITELRRNGLSIFVILAILAKSYQNLLVSKLAQTSNCREADLCRELQINPWQLQKIKPLSKHYTLEQLKNRYWSFLEIDLKLKSKSIGENNLETFLLNKLYPSE